MHAFRLIEVTHVLHDDRVVLDETAWSAKDDNTTVSWVRNHIVSDDAVGTAETDPISPLLESVGAAWTNIIVLNDCARACERSFGEVEAGPPAGIKRVDVFNLKTIRLSSMNRGFGKFAHQLPSVAASHLDVGASRSRWGAGPRPVDLEGVFQRC